MDFVDLIVELLETRGGESYLGEPVSQREHALQAAALAADEGASDSLIAAALLHDVGHLIRPDADATDGDRDHLHEEGGSGWLAQFFGAEVTKPVRLHVIAKRYLCTTDPAYRQLLSPASIQSLELQGGLLSGEEVRRFEQSPFHQEAIRVRRWDDRAKEPHRAVPGVESYVARLRRLSTLS